MLYKPIRQLDESTVNRIAAGEVIGSPVNAIKEMLENAFDAGATNVHISVKLPSFCKISVTDNGCGIHKNDFELLCKRFATSKIREYEDLRRIDSYGFRGEALASISCVSVLRVVSKHKDSKHAYCAEYLDGNLVSSSLKPCAHSEGTRLTVEDLFYNCINKKLSPRQANEEYACIVDMVSKYAINRHLISVSCQKSDSNTNDVSTISGSDKLNTIRTIYGASLSKELFYIEKKDPEFHIQGYASNSGHYLKKMNFILLVNGRLVESRSMRTAILTTYSEYHPKKAYPFVYIELDVNPEHLDVNVHPTKKDVYILHEKEIIKEVSALLRSGISGNSLKIFQIEKIP